MDTMQQIQEWKEKSLRYDNRRKVDEEAVNKIRNAITQMQEALDILYPKISTKKTSNVNFKELSNELYDLIQAGTVVSSDMISKVYPSLTREQCIYLMQMLSKMKNIDKRKDGVKVYLYQKRLQ